MEISQKESFQNYLDLINSFSINSENSRELKSKFSGNYSEIASLINDFSNINEFKILGLEDQRKILLEAYTYHKNRKLKNKSNPVNPGILESDYGECVAGCSLVFVACMIINEDGPYCLGVLADCISRCTAGPEY